MEKNFSFSEKFCLKARMEVFETEKYYIFVAKGKSLWWNRSTSEFQVKCGEFCGFFLFVPLKLIITDL